MIFNNKTELAQYLGCSRQKIYRLIEKGDIKELKKITTGKKDIKVGYVIVLEFIKYLLK